MTELILKIDNQNDLNLLIMLVKRLDIDYQVKEVFSAKNKGLHS